MKSFLYLALLFLSVSACQSTENKSSYDTSASLNHIGNDIIIANYEQLKDNAGQLKLAISSLKDAPSISKLQAAQNQFLASYTVWQSCSMFQFGPAVDQALSILNVYPTDSSKINSNISTGSYDIESSAQLTALGFPALDYLLFKTDEASLVNLFSDAEYSQYALDLATQIENKSNSVYLAWKNNYISTFVDADGQDVGSSISLLMNAMVLNFERNGREAKIGIPSGVRTLNEAIPEKVEAFYSQKSIVLAKAHIVALKELYEGKNDSSFKSILISEEKTDLAENISTHYTAIETALNTLSDPFSDMLLADNQDALSAYQEYQKLLPLLKVDMTAALGLLITYSDSDGD